MTLFEHDDKILVLDTGLMFPTEEMLGVDLVLPDFTYLRERKRKVVGVVLTHGHEDHIGGVPYLLREMNPPIFGPKLTLGLLRGKLDEHHLTDKARRRALREVIRRAAGRVVIACFASNIHRIQQLLVAARESDRVVAFIGRSMVRNVQIASELGYLDVPPGVVVSVEDAGRHPGSRVMIVCTGSQGEPLSALSLMAVREHRHIELAENDTVVF